MDLMSVAVALGEQGRITAPPNPWVGCLIVSPEGEVVGRGFHRAPGEPHAEVHALVEAGERARGATAYVTLEPCIHHGRTPPCAPALVEAGVARVLVALSDPDSRVSGQGLELLRDAGVAVEVGVGEAEAAASLAPYMHHRRTGRPYCLLKSAMSLDGRTAAADGTSRWITGPEARADAHRLRAESQAVVIGAGTALADQPTLTARLYDFGDTPGPGDFGDTPGPGDFGDSPGPGPPASRQPLRVLLDASGRVPAEGPLFDPSLAATLVITTPSADPQAVKAWLEAGADVEEVPSGERGVDLLAALGVLGGRGVLQAMVEGGATLHGALVRAGLVDRMVLYVGGRLLGEGGRPLLAWPGPPTMAEAPHWGMVAARPIGGDLRLDCEPLDDRSQVPNMWAVVTDEGDGH